MSESEPNQPDPQKSPKHAPMHKHSSNDAAVIAARRLRMGMIGVLVTAMAVLSALQMDKLPFLSNGAVYTAQLEDASGLRSGDSVVVAGVEVGKVRSITLRDSTGGDGTPLTTAEVTFDMADDMVVGTSSKASVQAETILGRRNLTITPAGDKRLKPGGDLPVEQTTPGYTLTEALQDTASTIHDTKLKKVDDALDAMSDAFEDPPEELRGAVAQGQHFEQLAHFVFGDQLLRSRTLWQAGVLQQDKTYLADGIDRLGPYANSLGEAVASAPYFQALAQLRSRGAQLTCFRAHRHVLRLQLLHAAHRHRFETAHRQHQVAAFILAHPLREHLLHFLGDEAEVRAFRLERRLAGVGVAVMYGPERGDLIERAAVVADIGFQARVGETADGAGGGQ